MPTLRKYAQAQSARFWEVAAACIVGPLGIAFCGLAVGIAYQEIQSASTDAHGLLAGLVLGLLGWLAVLTAARLLTGRGRKSDGGLFAPWVLRTLGTAFLIFGPIAAFDQRDSSGTIQLGISLVGCLLIGVACFYWAKHQQQSMASDRLQGNDT